MQTVTESFGEGGFNLRQDHDLISYLWKAIVTDDFGFYSPL